MTHHTTTRRHSATPAYVPVQPAHDSRGTPAILAVHTPPNGMRELHESFAVYDAMSDIVCVTSLDGTLRFLNSAGRDLLGFADDDARIGCIFPTHTFAARELLLDEVVPAVLRHGKSVCDTALQTADGRIFPAVQTVLVTPHGAGVPPTLTIVIRNVGIERQASARLVESQRLFEAIARSSPDLMYLYDPTDERIVWMNRCAHAFLGGMECDGRTLTRREMFRLVHPDERMLFRASARRMAAAYGDSEMLSSELRLRSRGGTWRWIHTRASVFSRRETGAPLLLLGHATDITARMKAEHRSLADRTASERANQQKTEFLSRLGSEFRTSVNAIAGLAAEIRADRDQCHTLRERELLDQVTGRTAQMLFTISDLQDFTRIENGEMTITPRLVDVALVIRHTVASFERHPTLPRSPIRVELTANALPVLTDAGRLRHALTHLITNALDFTTSGAITVRLLTGDEGVPLAIEIQDTGLGIPRERHERLFVPFEVAEQPMLLERRTAGTGLGLALARALCELIGCTLTLVRSAEGIGTTFRITLPVHTRSAELAALGMSDVSGRVCTPDPCTERIA